MSAYYHEDYDSLWSGLTAYLNDDPPEDQQQLLGEIEQVLAASRTDHELGALLTKLGSHAYLDDVPDGYRGWLEEIARRVRAHLEA